MERREANDSNAALDVVASHTAALREESGCDHLRPIRGARRRYSGDRLRRSMRGNGLCWVQLQRLRLRRVRQHRLPESRSRSVHRKSTLLAEQRPLLLRLRLPVGLVRVQLHVPRRAVEHAEVAAGSVIAAVAVSSALQLGAIFVLAGAVDNVSLAAAIIVAAAAGFFSAGST